MACMKLREHPDVLHGRPRERGALGGVVAESAAFFSSRAFRRRLRALVRTRRNRRSNRTEEETEEAISTGVVVPRRPSGGEGTATSRAGFCVAPGDTRV